jgi:hypothetical protein
MVLPTSLFYGGIKYLYERDIEIIGFDENRPVVGGYQSETPEE